MKMTHTLAEVMTLTVFAEITQQKLLLQFGVEVRGLELSHHRTENEKVLYRGQLYIMKMGVASLPTVVLCRR